MKNFNELPKEIQEEVKSILRAYDEIEVWFEYGRYTFGTSICVKYADDQEFVGTYYAKEIFTEEERIINYCEQFHDYPTEYKGSRDYSLIRDYNAKYKMIDGNIVRA